MSDNPQETSTGEQPALPVQPPTAPTSTESIPQPPQQVACPNCQMLVPTGVRYCPHCGFAIPPPTPYPTVPAPVAPPPRKILPIVVAIILIVVLVGGVAGYLLYQNNQQANKNSEATTANQAVNQFQFTCFTNITDRSTLYGTTRPYTGYLTVYEKFGVYNPTTFTINVTWSLTINYPSANWLLSNSQSFQLSPKGSAQPTFALIVTATEINNTPQGANFAQFTVTLDGTYTVTGIYSTYHPTSHSTYDSTTSTGVGLLASPLPASKC